MAKNTHKTDSDITFNPQTVKDELVSAILKHAKFDGFGVESFTQGADDIELDINNANALFPNIPTDIIAHWAIMLDNQSRTYGASLDSTMRIRDKIASLVKHRIACIAPHKVCLKSIMGISALPHNSSGAMHALYSTADTMWLSIGDNTPSTDRNHYTKRGILSAVLFCTISFYMQDDEADVERYIDERIDNALQLGKFKSLKDLKNFSQYLPFVNHPLKMRD